MSDPVGERLRSYYQSIQGDIPADLTTRVDRTLDSTAIRRARRAWRPAFGLLAAGAVVIIVALVVHSIGPSPTPTPFGITGPSASPSASAAESPAASPTIEPSTIPTTMVEASATPTPTPTTAPTQTPTERPTPTVSASPPMLPTPTATTAQFSLTGSMTVGRDGPTATRLKNGRILVAGGKARTGSVSSRTAAAELYDPTTGKFSPTGSMTDARWGHTATLLNDGRVLVAGGADFMDGADNLKSAELYDPAAGRFTPTGSMAVGRADHTATLLDDGRVLIAGGTNSIGLDSAEIYDPATGKFSATGSMTTARQDHTATLLADGRALIAGGTANGVTGPFGTLASAELYDPGTGRFTATGSMSTHRQGATATLMSDGSVMVTGGRDQDSTFLGSAEEYDPATGNFAGRGAGIPDRAQARTAVLLSDGFTLLTVGWNAPGATAATYDGGHYGFYTAGTTTLDIACQTATLLPDGRVLLLGGMDADGRPNATAALYELGGQS